MVVAFVQARLSSSRLPGKVLRPIGNLPIIDHVVSRLSQVANIDEVWVVTSDQSDDDLLEDHCRRANMKVFRGPLDDVLARFWLLARDLTPKAIIRATGDSPLIDPDVVSRLVDAFNEGKFDYGATRTQEFGSYPRGLDVEVMTLGALQKAFESAHLPYQREHVTPFFYDGSWPNIRTLIQPCSEDNSDIRVTVDTEEDLQVVSKIIENLEENATSWRAVVELARTHPDWMALNQNVQQRHYTSVAGGEGESNDRKHV